MPTPRTPLSPLKGGIRLPTGLILRPPSAVVALPIPRAVRLRRGPPSLPRSPPSAAQSPRGAQIRRLRRRDPPERDPPEQISPDGDPPELATLGGVNPPEEDAMLLELQHPSCKLPVDSRHRSYLLYSFVEINYFP